MKTRFYCCACSLLLFTAISGCNEGPAPSPEASQQQVDSAAKNSGDKLSREATQPAKVEKLVSEPAPPPSDSPAAQPRRRTVFDSLYEAVRNGAAEALDENAGSP